VNVGIRGEGVPRTRARWAAGAGSQSRARCETRSADWV